MSHLSATLPATSTNTIPVSVVSLQQAPATSAASFDRKSFITGLVLAAILVYIGFLLYKKMKGLSSMFGKKKPTAEAASKQQQQTKEEEQAFQFSPFVQDLKGDEESEKVLSAGGLAKGKILLVHAPWCGHCRNMMGAFVEAASTDSGHAEWFRVDGTSAPKLVGRADLKGYPTIYGVSTDGKVSQHEGGRDAKSLLAFASTLVVSGAATRQQQPSFVVSSPPEEEMKEKVVGGHKKKTVKVSKKKKVLEVVKEVSDAEDSEEESEQQDVEKQHFDGAAAAEELDGEEDEVDEEEEDEDLSVKK